jgi:hypothetical protein
MLNGKKYVASKKFPGVYLMAQHEMLTFILMRDAVSNQNSLAKAYF